MEKHRTVLGALFLALGLMGLVGMAVVFVIFFIGSAVLELPRPANPISLLS